MVKADVVAVQLAARQFGVLRRDQALAAGMTEAQVRHRVDHGFWERLFPGVYRVEGSPRSSLQELKAATLWAARGVAVSHRSAAALLGFDRYRHGPVELTVTRHLRPPEGVTLHQVDRLSPRELTSVNGICVTSPTRTLVDLAAIEPGSMVQAAVDQALRRKWTTLEKLDVATERGLSRRGLVFLRELIDRYRGGDGPSESELEALVRELLDDAGFPRPQTQRVLKVGGRVRRIDFRIPGTPILIEADGYAYHSSPEAFEKDRARNNSLIARGFVVLQWTWAGVRDHPEVLIAQLHATLAGCFKRTSPLDCSGAMSAP